MLKVSGYVVHYATVRRESSITLSEIDNDVLSRRYTSIYLSRKQWNSWFERERFPIRAGSCTLTPPRSTTYYEHWPTLGRRWISTTISRRLESYPLTTCAFSGMAYLRSVTSHCSSLLLDTISRDGGISRLRMAAYSYNQKY